MYFVIVGKNKEISLKEIGYIQPKNMATISSQIFTFETETPEKLKDLWWVIKRWKIYTKEELEGIAKEKKIAWVPTKEMGMMCKEDLNIRRYKILDIFHTDKEIKEKGIELVPIGKNYGVVEWYQNIQLYEAIDFWKPARSMHMGMMPAKLAHMMIIIAISKLREKWGQQPIIYDPFVWSWTTCFLANYLTYDCIWSDINTSLVEKNFDRWQTTKYYKKDTLFNIGHHDITQKRPWSTPKEIFTVTPNCIVTEWWLWPIVRRDTPENQLERIQEETSNLYETFIKQINELFISQQQKPIIVFTIPIYEKRNTIEGKIQQVVASFKSWEYEAIPEVYKREWQHIGRKIIILY